MQIQHLPTTEITLHPTAASLPKPDVDSPQFRALCATILEVGIPRPIPVNGFRAVAELDVLAAARHLGFINVPTVAVEKDDVRTFIVGWLAARNHYTKSQVAYLILPFVAGIIEEAKARRVANLKRGLNAKQTLSAPTESPNATGAFSGCKTMEQVADAVGISRKFLQYAQAIHKAFSDTTDAEITGEMLREKFEPLILEQDENGHSCGLGAILAGIAGYRAQKGQTVIPAPQLTLWEERIEKMFAPSRFNGWEKIEPATRAALTEKFRTEFHNVVPDELQAAVLGGGLRTRA